MALSDANTQQSISESLLLASSKIPSRFASPAVLIGRNSSLAWKSSPLRAKIASSATAVNTRTRNPGCQRYTLPSQLPSPSSIRNTVDISGCPHITPLASQRTSIPSCKYRSRNAMPQVPLHQSIKLPFNPQNSTIASAKKPAVPKMLLGNLLLFPLLASAVVLTFDDLSVPNEGSCGSLSLASTPYHGILVSGGGVLNTTQTQSCHQSSGGSGPWNLAASPPNLLAGYDKTVFSAAKKFSVKGFKAAVNIHWTVSSMVWGSGGVWC